ncbi:hypothetical protein LCGC14_0414640 [marine sediment metagenome]|uniref:Uncharacterized protein n=1 Tax=marine sediment metagenome TaxID=412755 RepID=A0A0F9SYP2_9ZZZZ
MANVDAKNMEAWLDNKPDQGRDDEDTSEEEKEENGDEEVSLEEEFAKLLPLLMEHGEMVEEMTDVLDPDLLEDEEAEYPEEELALLEDAVMTLPEDLQAAMVEEAMDIPYEAAMMIASHLLEEEAITSPERVAGFLFHASKVLEMVGGEEGSEEEEELEEELEEV